MSGREIWFLVHFLVASWNILYFFFPHSIFWLIVWLTDWLTGWLFGWLVCILVDWLTHTWRGEGHNDGTVETAGQWEERGGKTCQMRPWKLLFVKTSGRRWVLTLETYVVAVRSSDPENGCICRVETESFLRKRYRSYHLQGECVAELLFPSASALTNEACNTGTWAWHLRKGLAITDDSEEMHLFTCSLFDWCEWWEYMRCLTRTNSVWTSSSTAILLLLTLLLLLFLFIDIYIH